MDDRNDMQSTLMNDDTHCRAEVKLIPLRNDLTCFSMTVRRPVFIKKKTCISALVEENSKYII